MEENEKTIKSEPEVSLLVYWFRVIVETKKDRRLEQMNYYTRERFPSERELVGFYERLTGETNAVEIVEVERTGRALMTIADWENIVRTQGESKN